jgi:hypothetical protein
VVSDVVDVGRVMVSNGVCVGGDGDSDCEASRVGYDVVGDVVRERRDAESDTDAGRVDIFDADSDRVGARVCDGVSVECEVETTTMRTALDATWISTVRGRRGS